MKLDRKKFLSALSVAADVADRKATTPILANVLLRKADGGINVIATDTRTTVTTFVEADKVGNDITCSAVELCSMIDGLDCDDVTVLSAEGKMTIAGGGAKFTLATDNPRDFPSLPTFDDSESIEMDASALASSFYGTAYAALIDRPNLSGVWLSRNKGTMIACATNGHRLAFNSVDVGPSKDFGCLVYSQAAIKIAKLVAGLEKCQIVVDRQWIHVRSGGATLSSKLVEAEFIPYKQLIENVWGDSPAIVGRSALLSAVKRVLIVKSTDKDRATVGDIAIDKGTIRISRDGQNSKGEDSVKCSGGTKGDTYCNLRYLADAIEHMTSEEIELHVGGERCTINIRSKSMDQIAVIMPVRK